MLTTPIFTRLLSSDEYGQYNQFNSWLGILTIIVSLNLSMGVYTQGIVKFEERRNILSSSLQGLNIFLISVWCLIYLLFRETINGLLLLTTPQVLCIFVLVWTESVFRFWSSEKRVTYDYRPIVIVTLLASVGNPLLGIWLIRHSQDKVLARILGIVISEMLCYSWCFISQVHRGKQLFSKEFWKYAVLFNLPLIPHYLSQTLLNNSDRIMIGRMVGDSESGIYSLAYSLALIMTLFSQALSQAFNPWFYQKLKNKDIKEIDTISYLSFGLIGTMNLALIVFAPEIVAIFGPPEYRSAVYCIPPVAMGTVFLFSFEVFGKFAFYYEKTKSIMYASIGAAALNIILNYFGIKLFGYIAAAYTTLICYITFSVFHYALMKRVCRESMSIESPLKAPILLKMSAVFLAIGFLMLATYDYPVIRYSIIAVVLIATLVKRKYLYRKLLPIISLMNKKSRQRGNA